MTVMMEWIPTRNAAVQALFVAHPNEWLDSDRLAAVGGRNAWRTRVSNVRRHHGMTIQNRLRKDGDQTISEYRYVPESGAASAN